jgi:hypothetical protein
MPRHGKTQTVDNQCLTERLYTSIDGYLALSRLVRGFESLWERQFVRMVARRTTSNDP